jgi:hypothetical protein
VCGYLIAWTEFVASTIASLVMKHLVMTKENSERRKAMRMSQALSAFVDGKVPLAYAKIEGTAKWSAEDHWSSTDPSRTQPPNTNGNVGISASDVDNIAALDLNSQSSCREENSILDNGSHENFASFTRLEVQRADSGATKGQEERSILFARASFLMKDALEATGW